MFNACTGVYGCQCAHNSGGYKGIAMVSDETPLKIVHAPQIYLQFVWVIKSPTVITDSLLASLSYVAMGHS